MGMKHAFRAYMRDAWKADEYKPVTKNGENTFGGKGLTIIDSLDTLWLMGLNSEFEAGLAFVREDFVFKGHINVFENNIRVLGGLLGAYTVSNETVFLEKALEVGHVLLTAFHHRVPCALIDTRRPSYCGYQPWAGQKAVNAEVGTLSLEFETLSRLTGDPVWAQKTRALQELLGSQSGLLRMYIDPVTESMSGPTSVGGGIDSTYEYMLKMSLLTGNPRPEYDRFEHQMVETLFTTRGAHAFFKEGGGLIWSTWPASREGC